jgi:multiple sugar transport system permease protein
VEFCGIQNFISLFKSGPYRLAMFNMLRFNIIAVPLIIIMSFLLAILLRKSFKGKEVFNTAYIFPLVVPVASIVLFWQIIFSQNGALNTIFGELRIQKVNWYENSWSVVLLVLLYVWKNCGYNIILFTAGLGNIPVEYYESAYIEGAGRLTCLFKITLPYITPAAFFVFIISIINSFKVFREAYLLAGSYPNRNIYMLQHFMNNNFSNFFSILYRNSTNKYTEAAINKAAVESL